MRGKRRPVLHQTDEVRAARDERRLRIAAMRRDRVARIGGSRQRERVHRSNLCGRCAYRGDEEGAPIRRMKFPQCETHLLPPPTAVGSQAVNQQDILTERLRVGYHLLHLLALARKSFEGVRLVPRAEPSDVRLLLECTVAAPRGAGH